MLPALSAPEWAANEKRLEGGDMFVGLMYAGTSGPRLYTSVNGHTGLVRPELLHAAMALANDALADEHPGKIVRSDLAECGPVVAAKLEALLRPHRVCGAPDCSFHDQIVRYCFHVKLRGLAKKPTLSGVRPVVRP